MHKNKRQRHLTYASAPTWRCLVPVRAKRATKSDEGASNDERRKRDAKHAEESTGVYTWHETENMEYGEKPGFLFEVQVVTARLGA